MIDVMFVILIRKFKQTVLRTQSFILFIFFLVFQNDRTQSLWHEWSHAFRSLFRLASVTCATSPLDNTSLAIEPISRHSYWHPNYFIVSVGLQLSIPGRAVRQSLYPDRTAEVPPHVHNQNGRKMKLICSRVTARSVANTAASAVEQDEYGALLE
jgi:hypothetical protein